jgi:hypothetical protein
MARAAEGFPIAAATSLNDRVFAAGIDRK